MSKVYYELEKESCSSCRFFTVCKKRKEDFILECVKIMSITAPRPFEYGIEKNDVFVLETECGKNFKIIIKE